MKKIVVEWGHFYMSEWFSTESLKWWELAQQLCSGINSAETMLFIDDINERNFTKKINLLELNIDVSYLLSGITEKCRKIIENINLTSWHKCDYILSPNHIVLESEMKCYTEIVMDILSKLPKKRRLRINEWKWCFCSNIKIANEDWIPTCVWYDLWLTYLKEQMWFSWAINVLPFDYNEQQEYLNRLYSKVNSSFDLSQHYFQ